MTNQTNVLHCDFSSILVAEDKKDDQLLIKEAIEAADWHTQLEFVSDGEELLRILKHRIRQPANQQNLPALILLDLRMPKFDGYHILQYIKSNPRLRSIPVIVLSSYGDAKSVNTCYSLGANSFISKPPSFQEWVEKMKALKNYWFRISSRPVAAS